MSLRNTLALGAALLASAAITSAPASAAEGVPHPPQEEWSFAGPFGGFDRAQLQRGFKVYREVCSSCHSLNRVSFRNLGEPGGPEYSEAQVQALAAEYQISDGPGEDGEMFDRPGRPSDRFPLVYANEQAAAAANGKAPPDLSLMAKARTYERGFPMFVVDIATQYQTQAPDYIHALLTGYTEKPQDFELPAGTHYNAYFPGHVIAMAKPLNDGQVTYDDGAPATVDQYSRDVAAFLMWAAEPHLEQRKRMGFQVMIFLIVLAGLLYFTKKKIWHEVEKPREIAEGKDPAATSL
jgi:cytochrome c1